MVVGLSRIESSSPVWVTVERAKRGERGPLEPRNFFSARELAGLDWKHDQPQLSRKRVDGVNGVERS
jgi:hypothetical protein